MNDPFHDLKTRLLQANRLAERSRRIFQAGLVGGCAGTVYLILGSAWEEPSLFWTGFTMTVLGAACLWVANIVIDKAIRLLRDFE